MNLQQIIDLSAKCDSGILIELIQPYKKSLCIYYSRYYNCEPALIVTSVFNAAQYGFIAPSNEIAEAVQVYIDSAKMDNEDDKVAAEETILFNSILLKNL